KKCWPIRDSGATSRRRTRPNRATITKEKPNEIQLLPLPYADSTAFPGDPGAIRLRRLFAQESIWKGCRVCEVRAELAMAIPGYFPGVPSTVYCGKDERWL